MTGFGGGDPLGANDPEETAHPDLRAAPSPEAMGTLRPDWDPSKCERIADPGFACTVPLDGPFPSPVALTDEDLDPIVARCDPDDLRRVGLAPCMDTPEPHEAKAREALKRVLGQAYFQGFLDRGALETKRNRKRESALARDLADAMEPGNLRVNLFLQSADAIGPNGEKDLALYGKVTEYAVATKVGRDLLFEDLRLLFDGQLDFEGSRLRIVGQESIVGRLRSKTKKARMEKESGASGLIDGCGTV